MKLTKLLFTKAQILYAEELASVVLVLVSNNYIANFTLKFSINLKQYDFATGCFPSNVEIFYKRLRTNLFLEESKTRGRAFNKLYLTRQKI